MSTRTIQCMAAGGGGVGPAPQQSPRSPRRRAPWFAAARQVMRAAVLLACMSTAEAELSFGIRTQIWPFLFRESGAAVPPYSADEAMKREVALGNLDQYQSLGTTWNIVDAWQ